MAKASIEAVEQDSEIDIAQVDPGMKKNTYRSLIFAL